MFVQCLFLIYHLFIFSVYIQCDIFELNKYIILKTYMQFLCECMKIDCENDCGARGCQLKSYLGHQIGQGWN